MSISKKKKYVKLNKKYGKLPEIRFYPNPESHSIKHELTYTDISRRDVMRHVVRYIMSLPSRDQLIIKQIMQENNHEKADIHFIMENTRDETINRMYNAVCNKS